MTVSIKRKAAAKVSAALEKPRNLGGRPAHTTPEAKFSRIYALAPEQRAAINAIITDGKPLGDAVIAIKEGWGLMQDITDKTLYKYLSRYKLEVLDKQFIAAATSMDGVRVATVLAEVTEQIDVVKELAELVTVQKGRVSKLLNREKDMPMLFNSLGPEMKTLAGFVQQYADLSFDLGYLKKIPRVTKLTKDGDVTFIESDGRDHVTVSTENTKLIEETAAAFFAALEKGPKFDLVPEGGGNVPSL